MHRRTRRVEVRRGGRREEEEEEEEEEGDRMMLTSLLTSCSQTQTSRLVKGGDR